jgi:GLPGLI family protein
MRSFYLFISIYVHLFFVQSLQGQGVSVIYELTPPDQRHEVIRNALPEVSQQKIIERFTLTISNGRSRLSRDSVYVFYKNNDIKDYWYYKTVYKDYNKKLWLEESARYEEGHLYEQNLDLMRERNARWQWTITDEQQSIAGILCTKAVAKNGHIAWFAPDIPYLDGPRDGVFSLPGLVLSYAHPFRNKWTAVSVKLGSWPVTLPTGQRSAKKSAIDLPYNEWMALGKDKVIVIDAQTPQKTWLKFER